MALCLQRDSGLRTGDPFNSADCAQMLVILSTSLSCSWSLSGWQAIGGRALRAQPELVLESSYCNSSLTPPSAPEGPDPTDTKDTYFILHCIG